MSMLYSKVFQEHAMVTAGKTAPKYSTNICSVAQAVWEEKLPMSSICYCRQDFKKVVSISLVSTLPTAFKSFVSFVAQCSPLKGCC